MERRGADGGLQADLAGGAVALSGAGPVRPQPAQPGVSARRRGDAELGLRRSRVSPAAAGAEDRVVLVELRPAADADTRHAARARRLGGRAGGSVGAVRPRRARSRPSPPPSTSPGSRQSRCRCTGPTPGCRSASSSSVRRSATRSSSESPPSSKRPARGRTAVPRTRRQRRKVGPRQRPLQGSSRDQDPLLRILILRKERTSGTVIPLRERPYAAETYRPAAA